jgi:hypothetical protein
VSLLDGFFGGVLDNLTAGGRTDKKLARLAEQGELVPATIYAIRVKRKSDGDEWTYGLDLVTSAGPLRAAVRQMLVPEAWRAPLGGHVLARHLDGRVAIDWPATLTEAGVEHHAEAVLAGRTLKTPLEPGVDDDAISAKRLRDGRRCEAVIVSREDVEVMGLSTQNRRLELRVEDADAPRTVVLGREFVPPYADTLARAGARVPVAVHPGKPDRVTIDWAAAAQQAAAQQAAAQQHPPLT